MTKEGTSAGESWLSGRRLRWAGLAAVIGCAACCATPLLGLAFAGSGVVATIASVLKPGSELVVGSVFFVAALGVMAIRARIKPAQSCAVRGT